ncbi:MAG TPA: VWA domain-containing protein [Bryobacteraceae bacterium]|nr:VWA domain-containing protein [Bryobacteraceae bacterium]
MRNRNRQLPGAVVLLALPLAAQYIDPSKLAGNATGAEGKPAFERRITLDVVVTDRSGKPVSGLGQSDFTVIDDKLPQKLTSFQAFESARANPPTEVILLLDRINTPFSLFAQERIEAKKFLERNGGKLEQPVSLMVLSDTGTVTQPAGRDGNALAAALDRIDAGLRTVNRSQGIYGAIERLQMSLSWLLSATDAMGQRPGRKMMVWISPGWPILSGPGIQLTSKQQEGLFDDVVNMSTALRQARVVLYSIDPIGVADAASGRTTYYKDFVKGVTRPRGIEPGNLALQVLVEQSGGRVMNSGNDVAAEIAGCVRDAEAWYALSFDVPPSDGPDEYHALEVKVAQKGLTARTRQGYYDQP